MRQWVAAERDYAQRARERFGPTINRVEVIAVGPGGRDETGKLIPIDVKAGDRVLFGKWSGTEVKLDGVEYLIMKESDIMGVLSEDESKKKAA
jgi:chaperonin GroES